MHTYAVTLNDEGQDPARLELIKDAISKQGARNIEVHGMGILTVDSQVPINFAGIRGVESSQETKVVAPYRYMVALTEDANPQSVIDAIAALGADDIKHFDLSGVIAVGSQHPINFAAIPGILAAEPELVCHTQDDKLELFGDELLVQEFQPDGSVAIKSVPLE